MTMLLPSVFAGSVDGKIIKYTIKGLSGNEAKALRAEKVNEAKNFALQYNRPLLLEASLVFCPNCDNFEKNILDNATFKNFVKENGIVVLSVRDDALQTQTKTYYKPGGDTPNIYLFTIKQNTIADTTAFNKDEVEQPPLLASENKPTWTVSSFIALIKSNLPKEPDLKSIAIAGADTIATGKTATYTCTATWDGGSSRVVTPTWSLDDKTYAAVSADGVVTNNNNTTSEKTVTLKASYTDNSITKTATKSIKLAPITLASIAISGSNKLAPDTEESYTCTATWSNNSTTSVKSSDCTWSLRATDAPYATVSATGVVKNINNGETKQTVVLTASYTVNGITKSATKNIELEPDKFKYDILVYSDSASVYQAKKYAFDKNRPLLVLALASDFSDSSACGVFKKNIVESADFTTFIQTNKIVTLLAEDDDIQQILLAAHGTQTRKLSEALPQVYLFNVLKINEKDTIATAFAKDRVELLSNDNGVFAGTYEDDGELMGIPNGALNDWNAKTFTEQLEAALPQIVRIEIVGESSIANGYQAAYLCKAFKKDGSFTMENPDWSLDSDAYAELPDDGIVVNNNHTKENQEVTLTASFMGLTKTKTITLEPVTLFALAISGGASIVPANGTTFTCIATWSDWSTSVVERPTWSLDSTKYATVDTTGKVTNNNTTNEEKTATLTATYPGTTITNTLAITLASTSSGSSSEGKIIKYTIKGLSGTEAKELRAEKVNEAKNFALQNNRPLLLEASLVFCPNCDNFEKNILDNTTFKNFVKESGIVVLSVRDDALQTQTKTYYKPGGDTPNIYLFNIAQNTVADTTAFNKDEVEQPPLLASENQPSWTVSSFIAMIKSKLPAQKTLKSIAISGDASIATGSTATYTCKATWSDSTTSDVTPDWTLSAYTFASVANGVVANNNFTVTERKVTLTATYEGKTATKTITLAPLALTSLALDGPYDIDTASLASYVCKATWSNNRTNPIMPDKWTLSSTTYASVAAGVVTNKNNTLEMKEVTLTASYGGMSAKKENIALSAKELVAIVVNGDSTIESGASEKYTCTAKWSYGDDSAETATWSLTGDTAFAELDKNTGTVTNKNNTLEKKEVTLKASYSGKQATKDITLAKVPKNIVAIRIDGAATIASGATAAYACKAIWSDESETVPEEALAWSLVPADTDLATVNANGIVANENNYLEDKTVTLQASCTIGGKEFTDTLDITLAATPANTCLLKLNEGEWTSFGLAFTPDAKSLAAIKAAGTLWAWKDGAYVQNPDEFTAGMAAFIIPTGSTTIKLTGTVNEPGKFQPGWNLVSPQNLPNEAPAFMLDKATNSYIRFKDTKKADAAAWVFVK